MAIERNVYFIKCRDMVKIGASNAVGKRMAAIQIWCPYPLEMLCSLYGSVSLERDIQAMFDDDWSHSEWFHYSDRIDKFVRSVASGNVPDIPRGDPIWRRQIRAKTKQTNLIRKGLPNDIR